MIEVPLTKGKVASIRDEDIEIIEGSKWSVIHNGWMYYAYRGRKDEEEVGPNTIYMHRAIWEAYNGPVPSGKHIDHINGDSLDNRLENLRLATPSQNQQNSRKKAMDCSSKYKGVHFRKGLKSKPWTSHICLPMSHRKSIRLGYFKTEVEAALAYNRKAIELFSEFAHINMIEGVLG